MPVELRLLSPDGKEYKPLPRQQQFHACGKKFRAYVGGFGSGKTLAGVVEDIMLGLEYPGIRTLIGRKSYKELKATTQADFLRVCPKEVIKSFNKSDGHLEFKNGSEYFFWNLQDPETFKSLNLGRFHLDEATEISEEVFKILRGRLRQTRDLRGKDIPRGGILTTNPNGHDWVWKYFVQNQGKQYYRDNYALIHAPTYENKYLPEDYIRDLRETYPEEWLARFMEGSFDVFEGQVYPMLDAATHCIAPEDVPRTLEYIESLPKYRGIDHGLTNPTVCLWAAVDSAGNIFIYREYRRTKQLVSQNAANILALSGAETYMRTLIDPSTRNKTGAGDGRSIQEEYKEQGVFVTLANNQIRAGILRVSDYLRCRPEHIHPITRKPGAPRIFFLPGTEATFEELRMLAWKKLKPGADRNQLEEPEEKNDHGPDVVRYIVMDRPLSAEKVQRVDEAQMMQEMIRALSGDSDEEGFDYPRIGTPGGGGLKSLVLPTGYEITVA
jgi:PBSX family phage terminase large subunit